MMVFHVRGLIIYPSTLIFQLLQIFNLLHFIHFDHEIAALSSNSCIFKLKFILYLNQTIFAGLNLFSVHVLTTTEKIRKWEEHMNSARQEK